jgi:uncharacterized protein (TIGR02145 family)
MKNLLLFILGIFITVSHGLAQVGVNTDNSEPDPSAMLDVKSPNKGMLVPRMTAGARDAIASPVDGLIVYCINCGTDGSLSIYSNGSWKTFSPCTINAPQSAIHTMLPGQITWKWNAVPGATGYKWNTTTNYETATDNGSSTSINQSGLLCNASYSSYVWAYNNCGISTATNLTQSIPTVVPGTPTAAVSSPTRITIVWNWNPVAGAIGYKWNTSGNLETAVEMGSNTTQNETGLDCGTEYSRYVWAYNGCGYSSPLVLTQSTLPCWLCGDTITDFRDGKAYHTVMIGTQCWLKENLNVGSWVNISTGQTNNGIIEKFCFGDIEANCTVYGGLYLWNELMNYTTSSNANPSGRQGVCPTGWHVPSDAEWCQMETFLDPTMDCSALGWTGTDAGGKLKETGIVHWNGYYNTGATNSSGFTSLPGGMYMLDQGWGYIVDYAYYWTSTENNALTGLSRYQVYWTASEGRYFFNKLNAQATRCVKN